MMFPRFQISEIIKVAPFYIPFTASLYQRCRAFLNSVFKLDFVCSCSLGACQTEYITPMFKSTDIYTYCEYTTACFICVIYRHTSLIMTP